MTEPTEPGWRMERSVILQPSSVSPPTSKTVEESVTPLDPVTSVAPEPGTPEPLPGTVAVVEPVADSTVEGAVAPEMAPALEDVCEPTRGATTAIPIISESSAM